MKAALIWIDSSKIFCTKSTGFPKLIVHLLTICNASRYLFAMGNGYELLLEKKRILRQINDIKSEKIGQFKTDLDFKALVRHLKLLKENGDKLVKLKEDTQSSIDDCDHCEGEGHVKDSTGFYRIRCHECEGTGTESI